MSIAIYKRVSTDKQTTASQDADLTHWAIGKVVKTYSDTFTGKTMDRPAFNRLMADIRAGKVKTVAVWRMDRLGRTASGLTALFDEFARLGVNFVSLKDGVDLSTPAGRLMANVLASVAAYETEVRAERVKAGIQKAKAEGKTWGGKKKGQCHKRTPETVQAVRNMVANGQKITAIAKLLGLTRFTVRQCLKDQEGNA